MNRFSFVMLMVAALAGPATAGVPRPPPEIESIPVSILVDSGSGQVLEARQPDLSFVPASMTKVMTAYVAFEEMAAGRLDPQRKFTVRPETASVWNGRGTSMYLAAGERVTADQLLHGVMTASANDAAVVLAQSHAGSVAAWSFLMNDAARRLGMTKSRFNTPNGWPDEGKTYVSARDLVTLADAMIREFPAYYRRYSGKVSLDWHGVTLRSHDPVTGIVPGADGIKTGHTREAGFNFLGSAKRDGRRLIMVVAGAKSEAQRAETSRALLEWGFSAWRARPLFAHRATIAQARVQQGSARTVGLVTHGPVYATMPADGDQPIRLSVRYRGPLTAPIRKGAKVAELEITVGDLPPGRVPLYVGEDVHEASPMDRIMNGLMNLMS